jgi:hypothetical protein
MDPAELIRAWIDFFRDLVIAVTKFETQTIAPDVGECDRVGQSGLFRLPLSTEAI